MTVVTTTAVFAGVAVLCVGGVAVFCEGGVGMFCVEVL